jgi:hypothetical protein
MLAQFHLAHHAANAGQGFVASIRAARSHAPCSRPQCDGSRTNAKRCVPYAARATCNILKRDSLRSVQHTARTLTSASISSAASTSASAKTCTCHAPVVVSVARCTLRAACCTVCVLRRYTFKSHVAEIALETPRPCRMGYRGDSRPCRTGYLLPRQLRDSEAQVAGVQDRSGSLRVLGCSATTGADAAAASPVA